MSVPTTKRTKLRRQVALGAIVVLVALVVFGNHLWNWSSYATLIVFVPTLALNLLERRERHIGSA
ncbi:hypothetical protein [Aquihabitans sp. McL0605]|uniref:hypothetical protein n=1 Tax=Aquihabitans sp. McL0605 TaxID=3415671 RepID=UPI003CF2969C